MLNIVVPMAGRGSRFSQAGYAVPKPLIPVAGVPMIRLVIENLRPRRPHRFVFLVLQEMLDEHRLRERLNQWAPGCEIVPVTAVTEGAACTVLLARTLIDDDAPLMIANCDQWVDVDVEQYLAALDTGDAAGLIMTMTADDPKWSYVGLDDQGRVSQVVEKQVVSNHATVGVYNFRHGRDFCRAADAMIARNLRVNNEFYVAPVYNQLLAEGRSLKLWNVGKVDDGMYGLGVPEDLIRFEANPIARKAADAIT